MVPATRAETELNTNRNQPERETVLVRVGQITGAHGLAGGLRIRLDDGDSETLARVPRVFLRQSGPEREYKLLSVNRVNRTASRIVLQDLEGRDAAEAMRGATVLVAASDLPAARPGEFYYFQAVGCEVLTTTGQHVGVIEEVFSTGANEVLVVRGNGIEVLVPAIEDVVRVMDLEARQITIEAVPGLLD
jgi:16S rRNA processing protein RimM